MALLLFLVVSHSTIRLHRISRGAGLLSTSINHFPTLSSTSMKLSHTLLCLCILLVSPSMSLGAKAQEGRPPLPLWERDSLTAPTRNDYDFEQSTAGPRGLHYWHLPRGTASHYLHARRSSRELGKTPSDELAARAGPGAGAEQELKFLDKKPWGRRSLPLTRPGRLSAQEQVEVGAGVGVEPLGLVCVGRLRRRARPNWMADTAESRRPGWQPERSPPAQT